MPSPADTNGEIRGETGSQRLIGYVIDVGRGDERARCWLDITPDHLNRHGVLHGGIMSILLDTASGSVCAMNADKDALPPFMTVAFTTQFLAPVSAGRVTATAEIRGGGRALRFVDATLRDAAGNTLATSTGTFKRVPEERL